MNKRQLGSVGEDEALKTYEKLGYTLVRRNYQIQGGEIDLIVKNREFLVFCEVKLRRSDAFGAGAEAVTYQKQRHILNTAQRFLEENPVGGQVRFDVAVVTPASGGGYAVELIENAFGVN